MVEFDLKDVIEIEGNRMYFEYDPILENKLKYNILNGFKEDEGEFAKEKEQKNKELLSKFESPRDDSMIKSYTITP